MIVVHGELYSSKNSKQIFKRKGGSQFIAKSYKALAAEKPLGRQLQALKAEWEKMTEGKPYPYAVVFKIYRQTRRRFDYMNITQQLVDMMVKSGYMIDDKADCFIPLYKPYEVDKENPRVEIELLGAGPDIILTKDQLSLL